MSHLSLYKIFFSSTQSFPSAPLIVPYAAPSFGSISFPLCVARSLSALPSSTPPRWYVTLFPLSSPHVIRRTVPLPLPPGGRLHCTRPPLPPAQQAHYTAPIFPSVAFHCFSSPSGGAASGGCGGGVPGLLGTAAAVAGLLHHS